MTRNSKSNKDGSVFTYYERHRMRHGSETLRLPGGAMKQWHHCSLSLSTPRDPVLTPRGVLYDREAIVRHLLKQKEGARRRRADHERREALRRAEDDRRRQADKAEEIERLEQSRYYSAGVITGQQQQDTKKKEKKEHHVSNPNFWLPGADRRGGDGNGKEEKGNPSRKRLRPAIRDSGGGGDGEASQPQEGVEGSASGKTNGSGNESEGGEPAAAEGLQKKHKTGLLESEKTRCPVTGEPLRLKHLITLKLNKAPAPKINSLVAAYESDSDSGSGSEDIGEGDRKDDGPEVTKSHKKAKSTASCGTGASATDSPYICPMCLSPLTNGSKPVALRSSGSVLCARCVDRFVRRDRKDPVCGALVDLGRDVIVILNQGTAFAGSSADDPGSREARIYRPSVT